MYAIVFSGGLMGTKDALGRVIVATREETPAENLSEYLAFSGIDAVLCRGEDGTSFYIAVSEEDEALARKLIEEYESKDTKKSTNQLSPAFYSALSKLGEISDSAYFFIACGLCVLLFSVLRALGVFNLPHVSLAFSIIGIILGVFFTFFGVRVFIKSRQAKKAFAEENAYTLKVVGWFLGTYSVVDINKVIDADEATGASPSEQRRNIIKKYIDREFAVDDEDYLSYLTEEVYTALYHTRKLGGRK